MKKRVLATLLATALTAGGAQAAPQVCSPVRYHA